MKIAVVPAPGLGDGLIFHIISHNLVKAGYQVTTFHNHLEGFGKWLPGYTFSKEDNFNDFDAIILQHDNSAKSKQIKQTHPKVYGFYGSHQVSKHGPITTLDYVCDPTKPMVSNVQAAMIQWFDLDSVENGLIAPSDLVHRKHPKRIAIHSGSGSAARNWPLERYQKVASHLQSKGYDPVFIPVFPNLEDLASFIYESGTFLGTDSGPGHLSSYLQIPSVTIGTCYRHLLLWRPGWKKPCVVTPPCFVSRYKWLKNKWKLFIPTRIVIKSLLNTLLN